MSIMHDKHAIYLHRYRHIRTHSHWLALGALVWARLGLGLGLALGLGLGFALALALVTIASKLYS